MLASRRGVNCGKSLSSDLQSKQSLQLWQLSISVPSDALINTFSRFEPEHSTQEQLPLHEQLETMGSIGAAKMVPDVAAYCAFPLEAPGLDRVGIGAKKSSKVSGVVLVVKGVARSELCGAAMSNVDIVGE